MSHPLSIAPLLAAGLSLVFGSAIAEGPQVQDGLLPRQLGAEQLGKSPLVTDVPGTTTPARLVSYVERLPDEQGRRVVLRAIAMAGTAWVMTGEELIVLPPGFCDLTSSPNGVHVSTERNGRALVLIGCFGRRNSLLDIYGWDTQGFVRLVRNRRFPTEAAVSDQGEGMFRIVVSYHNPGREDVPDVYLADGSKVILANGRFPKLYDAYADIAKLPRSGNDKWRFNLFAMAVKARAYQGDLVGALSLARDYQSWLDDELIANGFTTVAVQVYARASTSIFRACGLAMLSQGDIEKAKNEYLRALMADRCGQEFPRFWIKRSYGIPEDERVRLRTDISAGAKWRKEMWDEFNRTPPSGNDEAGAFEAMGDDLQRLLRSDDAARIYHLGLELADVTVAERIRSKLSSIEMSTGERTTQ